jgi:opacity protein-like surface antigen
MNSLIKTSLLGLALVSTASMAGNFAGPEAGASVTMNGASTLIDSKLDNDYDANRGQQSIGVKLQAGYGFDMGNDTVVLVGVGYNPTDIKAGTANKVSLKIQNSWSLSVAPGLKLNDSSLAYVKLSYEAGKFKSNGDSTNINQSIKGFGYGIGLRTEINKTTFLETEIKQVNYNKFSYEKSADLTNSSTTGSVGVVFKF